MELAQSASTDLQVSTRKFRQYELTAYSPGLGEFFPALFHISWIDCDWPLSTRRQASTHKLCFQQEFPRDLPRIAMLAIHGIVHSLHLCV